MHKMTFASEAAQRRIEKIQQLLRGADMSMHEICNEIHLTPYWTRKYLQHLHEQGRIHIASYRCQKRNEYECFVALYCWGAATDAQKPTYDELREHKRQKRIAKRDDVEAHELHLKKRRAARIKPQRDWTAAWIPTKAAV